MCIFFSLFYLVLDLQEFENENTIVDQTNAGSRSEFPIFRAISPTPNTGHSINNTENNLDNRILSNIVNQNQVSILHQHQQNQINIKLMSEINSNI